MKIDINAASATQLAEFASVRFGIDIDHRKGRDAILAKLSLVGFSGTEIDIADPKAPASIASQTIVAAGARRMVRILIPNQNEPGGKDPVPVGVNGVIAVIKRGVEVDVPEEYVHVLTNAQKVQYDRNEHGRPINPTLVPTHPFSIIRPAA